MKKAKLVLLLGAVAILSLSSCTFNGDINVNTGGSSSSSSSSQPSEDTDLDEDTTENTGGSSSSSSSSQPSEDTDLDEDTTENTDSSESPTESETSKNTESTEQPNMSEGTSEDESSDSSSEPSPHNDEKYPTYRSYSYAFSNTDFNGDLTGGSFTRNGLTWTYTAFDDEVTVTKDSNGRGAQIGSSSKPQSNPWTLSTDFNETIELNSVRVYLYTSTSSGLTAHYDISFDDQSLTSSDFHSSKATDVQYAQVLNVAYEGNKLDISINAVNNTAFYLEAVVISLHTQEISNLRLSLNDSYIPEDYEETVEPGLDADPDDPENYIRYQSFAHKWTTSDLSDTDGGSVEVGGLTWTYSASTYFGKDGQYDRGVQIGSNGSPQYDPWTISVDFGETVKLTNISVQLYTTTSGNAQYSISFPANRTIGSGTFSTPGTDIEDAFSAEYSDIEYFGDNLSISLWSNNAQAFFLRAISFDVYTLQASQLSLVAEDLEDPEYDPQPVVPGVNNVKATKYTAIDETWESYYSTWDLTLTGEALRSELQDKNEPQTRYTYDDVRYMFPYSDEDPDNPGYMLGCYDGDKIPAYWDSARTDREHVWPCAHMKIVVDSNGDYRPSGSSVGHYSDLHNLRVSCKPVNNYKSDKYFDTYDDSNFFFPNVTDPTTVGSGTQHKYNDGDRTHDHRGDVARICLYMYAMYEELNLVDDFTNVDEDLTFGRLSTLLQWNIDDPVDDFETQRNNRIYEYQGNRNPFIDYPELANNLFA